MPAPWRIVRARAIGGGEKPRADHAAIVKRRDDPFAVMAHLDHAGSKQRDAFGLRFLGQRGDEKTVLDHMGERLARLDLAGEGEKHRPHGVVEPAVGDHHVEDRLRLPADGIPDAERLEQPPRRSDDGRSAFVVGVADAERRIGDRDGKRRPERLAQRNGKRQAGKAAARDQHIDILTRHGRILSRRCRA